MNVAFRPLCCPALQIYEFQAANGGSNISHLNANQKECHGGEMAREHSKMGGLVAKTLIF